MLISIRNKTANPIASLGLTANQTKVIWDNRTFFHSGGDKRPQIETLLASDSIEFLNEFDEVVVYWSPEQNLAINYELVDNMALFTGQTFPNTDALTKAEYEASRDIFIILANVFRRVKAQGLPNYNGQTFAAKLDTKNVCTLLNCGMTKQAANAFNGQNAMTSDAFFTDARRAFFSSICASLDLG